MSNNAHLRPNGAAPNQVPVTVPPQPVPSQWIVEQAAGLNEPMVIIRIMTPIGMHVVFLGVEDAKNIAKLIAQRATTVTLP